GTTMPYLGSERNEGLRCGARALRARRGAQGPRIHGRSAAAGDVDAAAPADDEPADASRPERAAGGDSARRSVRRRGSPVRCGTVDLAIRGRAEMKRLLLAVVGLVISSLVDAQTYPSRPVTIVVPY